MKKIAQQFDTSPNALYLRLARIRRSLFECVQRGMREGQVERGGPS